MKNNKYHLLWVLGAALVLSACSDSSDPVDVPDDMMEAPVTPPPAPVPVKVSYDVTLTNLTSAQPMSPAAVILHASGNLWQVGESASVALEELAEGGDNSALLSSGDFLATAGGGGMIGPGESATVTITVEEVTDARLSVATMLVNTNDAFTGLNAWDLGQLAAGESWTTRAGAYDAGTEANTEATATIPGVDGGSAGFDAVRDDSDIVTMHPGVVSMDDGLSGSVLSSQHRFDNPVLHIRVSRTE